MGRARWTYEPEEAVLKSAPRMDWVVRLLFYFAAGNETAVPYHQETLAERTWLVVEIAAVSWRAENEPKEDGTETCESLCIKRRCLSLSQSLILEETSSYRRAIH